MLKLKLLLPVLLVIAAAESPSFAQDTAGSGSLQITVDAGRVRVEAQGKPLSSARLAELQGVIDSELGHTPLQRAGHLRVVLKGDTLAIFRSRIEAVPAGDTEAMRRMLTQFVEDEAERFEERYEAADATLAVGREVRVQAWEHLPVLVMVGSSGTVDGVVDELVLVGSQVTVAAEGHVLGHALSVGSQMQLAPGAEIEGQQVALQLPDDPAAWATVVEPGDAGGPPIGQRILGALMTLVASLLVGLLYLRWGAGLSQRSLVYLSAKPGPALGYGMLTYLALIPMALMLVLSILGILLLPPYALAVGVLLWLGHILSALWLGSALLRSRSWLPVAWQRLLLGLLLLAVVGLIPYLGGLVLALCNAAGVGATVVSLIKSRGPRPADAPASTVPADVLSEHARAEQHG